MALPWATGSHRRHPQLSPPCRGIENYSLYSNRWTGRTSARQSRRFAPELPRERTISWPAGARTRGCRADLPPQPLAWVAWMPGEAGDQGRPAAGAWRIPRPVARRRAAWEAPAWEAPAWPAAAPGERDPSADRGAAGPRDEPAGRAPAFSVPPLAHRGGQGPRQQVAAAGSPCASPDDRARPHRAWPAARPAPDAAIRRCRACGAAD